MIRALPKLDYDVILEIVGRDLYETSLVKLAKSLGVENKLMTKKCFGIDYPINIEKLVRLINEVLPKEVRSIELPNWNTIAEQLINIHFKG